MPHPLLVMSSFACKQLLLSYFLTHQHALNNESRLRCAISCDLLPPWSCDRISIKLQLTGKSRLMFQFPRAMSGSGVASCILLHTIIKTWFGVFLVIFFKTMHSNIKQLLDSLLVISRIIKFSVSVSAEACYL